MTQRLSLRLAAIALIAALPAYATLVVFQWTPERILLAADSLTAKVHDSGEIERVIECKIHQQGNIFFAIVGINDDPGAKVDLVSLAAQAARGSRNLPGVIHSFEATAAGPVRKLWDDVVKHRGAAARLAMETDGSMSLTVIFVSRREHAIALKEYSGSANGDVAENLARFYGSASGMRKDRGYVAVGVYANAEAAAVTNRQLAALEGVPFIDAVFQVQISHEQARIREHGVPRIGAPVCVLQVMTGAAEWVNGHQGACGQIKP
jgi:hypothetical protein